MTMTNIPWDGLPKTQIDPTTIDEQIAADIAAHNADPDAHMEALASLAQHRESEIVDHLAESVVNDKLAVFSRSFVAIVDPASDTDFDTIQGALAYAITKGGGTILITPGDHYITGAVKIPETVNFVGTDRETCKVHAGATAGDYFYYDNTNTSEIESSFWQTINIIDDGNGFMKQPPTGNPPVYRLKIVDCVFSGAGVYLGYVAGRVQITGCFINLVSNKDGFSCTRYLTFNDNFITAAGGSTPARLINQAGEYYENWISLYDNYGDYDTSSPIDYLGPYIINGLVSNNFFWGIRKRATQMYNSIFSNNLLWASGTGSFSFEAYECSIVGNFIVLGGGDVFTLSSGSETNIITGNFINVTIADNGNNSLIANNLGFNNYVSLASTTTALALKVNEVVQITPNANRTLTTTVPLPGTKRTVIFLTSGATSYTQTFGTGFRSAGTLATGTVANRYFVLEFISNGTVLIETRRTAAIVA